MNDGISKAIFGSFDGVTCVLGVIGAGIITGDTRTLVLAAAGLAIAEACAMAGGSYLSEVTSVNTIQHAAITGVSSFVGIIVPALPFLFLRGMWALIGSAILTCALAVVIAQTRVSTSGWLQAYAQTFAILFAAGGASILVTLALNGVGA